MVQPVKVLFACAGNICRSPTAEGVFKLFTEHAGLSGRVLSDSAGTHGYHVGEAPEPSTQRAAEGRGYDLGALRARQVTRDDFGWFDYILAMDRENVLVLRRICPPQHSGKLKLFMEFGGDPAVREVPDPYYGDMRGFERVLHLAEQGSRGLLEHLRERIKA